MKYTFFVIFLSLSISLFGQSVVVKTTNGKVAGGQNIDKTVQIFKGIPFAKPPLGNLRWQAPQPPSNWSGIKQCTQFGASPIQNKPQPFYCWSAEFIAQPEPLNEDCLYLNIWKPTGISQEKKAVLVWIYGGGLSSGSANCAIYDGEEMAKKGILFVSINYRVGVLGFMAHQELSSQLPHHVSGNYGILDQIEALRWVQKNIAAFGGDRNNITIAGQSAGAFSVNALIASPLAKGLFHKAIAQSGGLLSNKLSQSLENSEKQGQLFMQKAGARTIDELRKMSANDLQTLSNNQSFGQFGLTLDGYLLPKNLNEHFEKGLQNQVPTMTGWVAGDGDFLGNSNTTLEDYKKEAQSQYGPRANDFLSIFLAQNDDDVKTMKKKLTMLGFAGLPSHLLASFNTQPTYLYYFNHVPVEKSGFPNYGAFHTSEVPFSLHTLHKWDRPWRNADKLVEGLMSSYWVNFAKTGNPNADGLPNWSSYNKQLGNMLMINENTHLQPSLFKKELDFLEAEAAK